MTANKQSAELSLAERLKLWREEIAKVAAARDYLAENVDSLDATDVVAHVQALTEVTALMERLEDKLFPPA